jgi:hypothetical protein
VCTDGWQVHGRKAGPRTEGRCTDGIRSGVRTARARGGTGACILRAGRNQYASGVRALRCGRTTGAKHLEDRRCHRMPLESSQPLFDGLLVECLKTFIFVQHLVWARFVPKAFPMVRASFLSHLFGTESYPKPKLWDRMFWVRARWENVSRPNPKIWDLRFGTDF